MKMNPAKMSKWKLIKTGIWRAGMFIPVKDGPVENLFTI
jgi:hypothetical protein